MPTDDWEWLESIQRYPRERYTKTECHLARQLEAAWSREAALKTQISELEVMASPTLYFYNWRKAGSTIRRLRRRWQWERRRAERYRVKGIQLMVHAFDLGVMLHDATKERDAARAELTAVHAEVLPALRRAARAAGYHEALDSVEAAAVRWWVNGMRALYVESAAMAALRARYPREKREEAGR